MLPIVTYVYIFPALLLPATVLMEPDINDRIKELIPNGVNNGSTCLVNTNRTFNFPVVRFVSNDKFLWLRNGLVNFSPDLYIIELFTGDNLEEILFDLHKNSLFDPRSTYVLITEPAPPVVKSLKKFYIRTAFVVTRNGTTYSYKEELGKSLSFTDTPTRSTSTENVTVKVGFLAKPPYVICPECRTNKGIEVDLFNLASAYMKIKVEYIKYNTTFLYWGDKLTGTYTYLFKELFDRKFDVICGQVVDMYQNHIDFDRAPIHIIDSMRFVVPKAKINKQFNLFDSIFNSTMIKFYVAVLIILIIIYALNRWKNGTGSFMDTLGVLFDVSFDTSRIKWSVVRLLYASFMLSAIIYNTAFKAELFSSVTSDHFDHQIDSWEEIVRYNLLPVFNNVNSTYFTENNTFDMYMNAKGLRICNIDFKCVDYVAFQRNVTTMKLTKALNYYTPRKYLDKDGRVLIHVIDRDVQLFHVHFYFIKGHPIFERFDKVLLTLNENGINKRLNKQYDEGNKKVQIEVETNLMGIKTQKLNLQQLVSAFQLYVYGMLLSVVVFLVELSCKCLK